MSRTAPEVLPPSTWLMVPFSATWRMPEGDWVVGKVTILLLNLLSLESHQEAQVVVPGGYMGSELVI
jgi:hypothetical protein